MCSIDEWTYRYGDLSLAPQFALLVEPTQCKFGVYNRVSGKTVTLEPALGIELLRMIQETSSQDMPSHGAQAFFEGALDRGVLVCRREQTEHGQIRILKSSVRRLFVELTSACNLTCPHCYGSFGTSKAMSLDLDVLQELFCQAVELGIYRVDLTGGEPAMYQHLDKVLELLRSYSMAYTIFSNLTILRDSTLRLMSDYRPQYVITSVESFDSNTHDKFRGGCSSHFKTVENIQRLIRCNVRVKVNLVVGRHNVSQAKKTIDWLLEQGVSSVAVDTIRVEGRAKKGLCADGAQIRALFDALTAQQPPIGTPRPCGVGNEMVYVDSLGRLRVCPSLTEQDFVLGSVYEEGFSLAAAVKDLPLRYASLVTSSCRASCPAGSRCYGGCPARSYAKGMDPAGPDVEICGRYL